MLSKKKNIHLILKVVFGLAAVGFVGWKIFHVLDNEDFSSLQFTANSWLLFFMALILMMLNWSLEAFKWKLLMDDIKPLTFRDSVRSVLAGLSTGILTPNRMGNFIGRTIYLEKEIKIKAILRTLLANLAQFIVTVLMGLFGLPYTSFLLNWDFSWLLGIASAILAACAALLYIKPDILNRKPWQVVLSEKVKNELNGLSHIPVDLKLRVLLVSFLRYMVFTIQYVFLVSAFEPDHNLMTLFAGVTLVYLLMTLIPSLFFGKLFVREAAGLLVLSTIGIPDVVILASGFVLWFINIALPSLYGSGVLITKK